MTGWWNSQFFQIYWVDFATFLCQLYMKFAILFCNRLMKILFFLWQISKVHIFFSFLVWLMKFVILSTTIDEWHNIVMGPIYKICIYFQGQFALFGLFFAVTQQSMQFFFKPRLTQSAIFPTVQLMNFPFFYSFNDW